MPPRRKSRARRVLGVIGAVVGTTVTFVAATATAAVVHLDVPATRRLVTTQVNKILADQFAGTVAIERLGGLSLRGVSGVRVRVKDPSGMSVLFVDGARVRLRALEAARSALFGKGDIVVPVDAASIDHVEAAIDTDPAGNLRIANAFAEKHPTPPKPADPNARGVRVEAPDLKLGHAWVHGQAGEAPPVDAEVAKLVARAHVDPKVTRAEIDNVELVTRGLPRAVDPRGRITGRVVLPTGKDMSASASFDGAIAGVATVARGDLDGKKFDAVVDARDPMGQGMRSTFEEVSIRDEVTLHAEAHGALPRIAAQARVALGAASVAVDGNVDMSDGTKAEAKVAVRHVDLKAIVPDAPPSDLGLDTTLDVVIDKSGALRGNVALVTLPGEIDGEKAPILRARSELTKDTVHATGTIEDPRATADFAVDMHTEGEEQMVEGQLRAAVDDFSKLPKVGSSMKGRATVTAEGRANLGAKTLDANARVVANGVAYGAQKIDNATVLARAQGSMDRPVVSLGVHAGGIAAGEEKLGVADIRARVEPGAVTTIRDAHVDVVREGHTLTASADRVEVGGPTLVVQGGVIQGLGEPIHADFSRSQNELRVKVDAPGIDLPLVARLARKPEAVRRGRLSMNGDVVLKRESARGELSARVEELSASSVEGGNLDVAAAFDDRRVRLNVKGQLADAGTFEIATTDVVLAGSPIEPASWSRAHGRAKFDVNIDAAKAMTLAPKDSLPFSELAGRFVVAGTLRRDSGNVPPEVSVHAHTRGLVIAGKTVPEPPHDAPHGKEVRGIQPWRSQGVDVSVDAKVDATSGFGELAFHAVDQKGTLVGVNAKSDLPYRELFANPSSAAVLLRHMPLTAKVVVPKRALSEMPAIANLRSVPGTFEAELDIHGSAVEPHVQLVAHARGIRAKSLPDKMSSDADVEFTYDGNEGKLLATVSSEKREVLELTADGHLRARDLVAPASDAPLDWGASAKVKLASFALESVAPLADRKIRGRVTGEASIEDLHEDGKLRARIDLAKLKIGRASYEKGFVTLEAVDGKLAAHARLEQTDGYADVSASTQIGWGSELVPTLDENADLEARLDAKGFRAAAIRPFLEGTVNALDGRIDANANVRIGPGFSDPTMQGRVVYREGTLQLAALGEEFKDARATVTFQPDGIIRVDDVFMRGIEGELTAGAVVQTQGLALGKATAHVDIPNNKPLDVSMDGQPIGAVSGNIKVAASGSADGKNLDVRIDVPKMKVELPQKMKSGVQELGEQEKIRVGVFRTPNEFVKLPLDKDDLEPLEPAKPVTSTTTINVGLGEITIVQGNTARVVLGGNPQVRITDAAHVSGRIEVKEGTVDVQGKKFEIEKGIITFQPDDTANPIVVATAAWTAEDGSKIYADFTGPVKTGKVTLRSEPARPRNEILAIILFGTADGANASPPPPGRAPDGKTQAAVGVGGGLAAQGLTEAMDDLTGVQATARIDTTRSRNPAPEIEVQLARRLSIEFAHILGTPPLSEPDKNLATFDWRFRRKWSLETTFGDRGKLQTDVVWQKRY